MIIQVFCSYLDIALLKYPCVACFFRGRLMLKKLIALPFIITLSYSQLKDLQTQSLKSLRNIVENASRSNQKVWLEDFTGID